MGLFGDIFVLMLKMNLFQDTKYKFMVAVLVEYIKSLNHYQIPAQVRIQSDFSIFLVNIFNSCDVALHYAV